MAGGAVAVADGHNAALLRVLDILGQLALDDLVKALALPAGQHLEQGRAVLGGQGQWIALTGGEVVDLVDDPLGGELGEHGGAAGLIGLVADDQLAVLNEHGHVAQDVGEHIGLLQDRRLKRVGLDGLGGELGTLSAQAGLDVVLHLLELGNATAHMSLHHDKLPLFQLFRFQQLYYNQGPSMRVLAGVWVTPRCSRQRRPSGPSRASCRQHT